MVRYGAGWEFAVVFCKNNGGYGYGPRIDEQGRVTDSTGHPKGVKSGGIYAKMQQQQGARSPVFCQHQALNGDHFPFPSSGERQCRHPSKPHSRGQRFLLDSDIDSNAQDCC